MRHNTILGVLQSSNAGSMDILATNEGAVAMVAGMFVDAAKGHRGRAQGTVLYVINVLN